MFRKLVTLSALFIVTSKVVLSLNSVSDTAATNFELISPRSDVLGMQDTVVQPEEPFVFAALPSFDENVKTSVKTADARAEIIRQYLHKFESPLEPQAELIVELSDKYNFDYRWMVAIAQQESGLCLHIPENSYNCWGWGIYPEPSNPAILKVTRFDSYDDALRRIAPQFTKIFLKGSHFKDPMEVMKTYTPPSDGSWANGVNSFFGKLE
jgi:hypothetical protein